MSTKIVPSAALGLSVVLLFGVVLYPAPNAEKRHYRMASDFCASKGGEIRISAPVHVWWWDTRPLLQVHCRNGEWKTIPQE